MRWRLFSAVSMAVFFVACAGVKPGAQPSASSKSNTVQATNADPAASSAPPAGPERPSADTLTQDYSAQLDELSRLNAELEVLERTCTSREDQVAYQNLMEDLATLDRDTQMLISDLRTACQATSPTNHATVSQNFEPRLTAYQTRIADFKESAARVLGQSPPALEGLARLVEDLRKNPCRTSSTATPGSGVPGSPDAPMALLPASAEAPATNSASAPPPTSVPAHASSGEATLLVRPHAHIEHTPNTYRNLQANPREVRGWSFYALDVNEPDLSGDPWERLRSIEDELGEAALFGKDLPFGRYIVFAFSAEEIFQGGWTQPYPLVVSMNTAAVVKVAMRDRPFEGNSDARIELKKSTTGKNLSWELPQGARLALYMLDTNGLTAATDLTPQEKGSRATWVYEELVYGPYVIQVVDASGRVLGAAAFTHEGLKDDVHTVFEFQPLPFAPLP